MHYCFFTSGSWEQNAAHIRVIEMGRELIDRGHRVAYMLDDVPYNRGDLWLHPKSELAFVKDSRSLKQITNRRKLFKELQPDYVHLLQGHAKSYSALVGMDFKLIGDWDEPRIFQDFGFARNRIESFVDRWLRKRAFVRIACTSYIQKVYRERFGMETVYIPHAPYLPSYPEVDSPFSEPTAVYMGNFFAAWDHDIALHAAVILKERGLTPRMLFMGSGPDFEKWKAFVAEKGLCKVEVPGFVSGLELWRRLRHAHVLLFPIRDTMINRTRCPSKVFAYAQASRPIITSRVGELPYMLGQDKPIYIESTPPAFADAIANVMSKPPLPDVQYHLENHSWRERVDRLLRAIDQTEAATAA